MGKQADFLEGPGNEWEIAGGASSPYRMDRISWVGAGNQQRGPAGIAKNGNSRQ